jgi:uncharacterized membrane protein YhaH (DUF805 family)
MEWMLMPFKRYADFSGRSRRKEYWMYALMIAVVVFVLEIIGFAMAGSGATVDPNTGMVTPGAASGGGLLVLALLGIFLLATLIPSLAVMVRRFHDQDKSGWFVLLSFIPFVGGIIVLVFMCLPGTPGPNQYGPDPLGGDGDVSRTFS